MASTGPVVTGHQGGAVLSTSAVQWAITSCDGVCVNLLDGGIDETYHLDPTRQLEHQVEADECSQSAGSKGQPRAVERHDRAPRPRWLQLRGRATAALGRPPCWAW